MMSVFINAIATKMFAFWLANLIAKQTNNPWDNNLVLLARGLSENNTETVISAAKSLVELGIKELENKK